MPARLFLPVSSLALLGASAIGAGSAVGGGHRITLDVVQSNAGLHQQTVFLARLRRLAAAIDRAERTKQVAAGPAAFMRQDLDRIWAGVTSGIALQGVLSPSQCASYAAMLDRIVARLTRRGITL